LIAARRRAQASVKPVRPGVVRALQGLAALLAFREREAAVPADVDETAQHAVAVTRDDDRRPAGRCREVARLRDLSRVPDVLPRRTKDPVAFPTQDLRVGEPTV